MHVEVEVRNGIFLDMKVVDRSEKVYVRRMKMIAEKCL